MRIARSENDLPRNSARPPHRASVGVRPSAVPHLVALLYHHHRHRVFFLLHCRTTTHFFVFLFFFCLVTLFLLLSLTLGECGVRFELVRERDRTKCVCPSSNKKKVIQQIHSRKSKQRKYLFQICKQTSSVFFVCFVSNNSPKAFSISELNALG